MPGFHFPTLKIVGPTEKVVLCLKGWGQGLSIPLGQIPSRPELI